MDASTLVLPANLLVTALALIMSGIAILFQIRKDRLPAATRYENVREMADQAERVLAERRAELSIVEQKIQDRDRLIAEVAGLEERKNIVQAEHAMLDDARREIGEVKVEAAFAAAQLATVNQELEGKRSELAEITQNLDPARIAELKRKFETLENDVQRLEQERSVHENALHELRIERDSALKQIEEARIGQSHLAAQEAIRDRLKSEIIDLDVKRKEQHDLESRLGSLREKASNLDEQIQRDIARQNRLTGDITTLQQRRDSLADEIKGLQNHRDELDKHKKALHQILARHGDLSEEIGQLLARKERLSGETGTGGPGVPDEEQLLQDLIRFPICLEAPDILRKVPRPEGEALHAVSVYLKEHGLEYSTRTVHAFHTALKINDNSQLTVLAGVSGTGKSLLPRRYAEAMGIHFLQIAVEPRWDSPQDLLGFYNYIEKKYRATDLARLLVHMDPYASAGKFDGAHDRKDHMSLVLLDEMNLARVEYYFSEFLSRLEVRPRFADVGDPRKRNDALIPIDIRGLKKPISLFPSHNVMFTGTMNDDESTQALSDKVLDRGNVMQFAAPKDFTKPKVAKPVGRPDEAQSFKSWRTWVKSPDTLAGVNLDIAKEVIEQLAGIMENCGRPFGHRLRDSMLAYVASYPFSGNGGLDVRIPLADQIEFRILPKLRGIEIDSHREQFDHLDKLLREKIADSAFAERFTDLRDRQNKGTGLFVWRGLTREG